YRRLDALYREPISRDEKVKRREPVFEEQRRRFDEFYKLRLSDPAQFEGVTEAATDNATALAAYRYHSDLGVYRDVYSRSGNDLRALMGVLKKAAGKMDSFGYLRRWTATGPRA